MDFLEQIRGIELKKAVKCVNMGRNDKKFKKNGEIEGEKPWTVRL